MIKENTNEFCPCCPNHCTADALHCGKGRRYFEEASGNDGSADTASVPTSDIPPSAAAPAAAKEDRLFDQFTACSHILHHRGRGGAKSGQLRILSVLSGHGPLTQRELLDILDIRSGSLSEILGKMEAAGHISRTPNAQDRRSIDVALTPEGAQAASQLHEHKENSARNFFSALTEEEKEQLSRLLGKLLSQQRSREDDFKKDRREDAVSGNRPGQGGHTDGDRPHNRHTDDGHPHGGHTDGGHPHNRHADDGHPHGRYADSGRPHGKNAENPHPRNDRS